MEQILIVFYALTSFFQIEQGRIYADKSTVTLYPQKQEIVITHQGLFTIIQSPNDSIEVNKQWSKIKEVKMTGIDWSEELDDFEMKSIDSLNLNNPIQSQITLKYSDKDDLRKLGIWYNSKKNEFSINEVPEQNIKSNEGKQEGNYWYFDAKSVFSFRLDPFLEVPDHLKKNIYSLNDVIK